MKNVKSLTEELVATATDLGRLEYRLRAIEEIIKGYDARADDISKKFRDRDFVEASLALQRRSRGISIRHRRRVKNRVTRARSQITATTMKLERLSGRP